MNRLAQIAAAALLCGAWATAAQAQGQRDIPAPEAERAQASMESGAFPPAPVAANAAESADNAASGAESAGNLSGAGDGGAALWPSVAAAQNAASQNAAGGQNLAQNTSAPLMPNTQNAAQPEAALPDAAAQQQAIRDLQSQMEVLKAKLAELESERQKMQPAAPAPQNAAPQNPAPEEIFAKTPADDDENAALPADMSADNLYRLAQADMAASYYGRAAGLLRAFGERYGADARAAEAAFQLGECYYARGLYAKAAEVYLDVQTKYKNAAVAPQNLLRLAQCMEFLQDTQTACATLEQLSRQYRQADAALLQKGRDASARLQCP